LHTISGTVSFDKKPIPDGKIVFSTPGAGHVETLEIKDGKYEGQASEGKRRVEIFGFRPSKQKSPMPGFEVGPENYIPARYNTDSKLEADVKAGGKYDFDLTSTASP
jgi:hypothetical protein